jgi:signal transduction histidine kinase
VVVTRPAGAAGTRPGTARASRAAQQALAGSLLEASARGERARIVRELHDVVAHHISLVAVQAETARLATPGLPSLGAQRLSAIGDTARAALGEMRRLLGVLREDVPETVAQRQPAPGLRELLALLDEAREATGTGIRLILRGSPVELDPGVELAVHRIVQEALTNSRRHAPGAAVDVERTAGFGCACATTARRRHRLRCRAGTGYRGCGNVPPPSGGSWPPGRSRSADSWSRPPCRCTPRS